MIKLLLLVISLAQISEIFAADSFFCTSIKDIEAKLTNTSVKRLVIGGLHKEPWDMKGFWILSDEKAIVINCDLTAAPDIHLNIFSDNLIDNLAPLATLLKENPKLKFNEIVFEHVGCGSHLKLILEKNLALLVFLNDMLAVDGKFVHQSSYKAIDTKKVFKISTFQFLLGFKESSENFKGLDKVLAEELTIKNLTKPIKPEEYSLYFQTNSYLIQYTKVLENILKYTDVTLAIEMAPQESIPQGYCFSITAKKHAPKK